ncbi:MAG: hypothetical protein KJO35_08605 [Gammaproteobacteria bacterium]|nr:hypothetical protein [Gammaproteobacteria bacterium]
MTAVEAEAAVDDAAETIRDEELVVVQKSPAHDTKQWRCERRAPVGTRVKETECTTLEQRLKRREEARKLLERRTRF